MDFSASEKTDVSNSPCVKHIKFAESEDKSSRGGVCGE